MGYCNKDARLVNVSRAEKQIVNKKRRLALKRELKGENIRGTWGATRRGWWYA